MKKGLLFVVILFFVVAGASFYSKKWHFLGTPVAACDEKGAQFTQGGSAACGRASEESVDQGVQPTVAAKAEIKEVAVKVEGLHCASCAAKINEALQKTGSVVGLDVDLDQKVCKIKYDAKRVTPKDLVSCINKNTPYKASLK